MRSLHIGLGVGLVAMLAVAASSSGPVRSAQDVTMAPVQSAAAPAEPVTVTVRPVGFAIVPGVVKDTHAGAVCEQDGVDYQNYTPWDAQVGDPCEGIYGAASRLFVTRHRLPRPPNSRYISQRRLETFRV